MGQTTKIENQNKVWNTIKQTMISVLFATVFIYLFNMVGVNFNLHIPINLWTIAIVAFLRVPGVVLLLVGLAL